MKNAGIDYKRKYEELKARYIQALDVAFRAGYEQGFNESQIQSMAQQAQQMQAQMMGMAQQQAAMGGGMEGQATGSPEEQAQMEAEQQAQMQGQQAAGGDEMDQAISQLEQLVNKSEPSIDDLKKSIELIKSEHMHKKLTKKTKSVDITPKPFSMSYKSNLTENSKASVALQQKIVDDILRKWEHEESSSSRDITQILGTEALTKKEK